MPHKETKKLLLIMLLFFAPLAGAQWVTGTNLKEYCFSDSSKELEGVCYGYVVGVADSLDRSLCIPPAITRGQLADIVKKFLRTHPEKLQGSATTLVSEAIQGAFPCRIR